VDFCEEEVKNAEIIQKEMTIFKEHDEQVHAEEINGTHLS
jgi:hypothetical protein